MEWLKKLLGEEAYNKLGEDVINILKAGLGELEYIANDPTKVTPKHVFNQKLEEIKNLKSQVEDYKSQMLDTKNLITDEELKKQIQEKELEFKQNLAEKEKKFKKELDLLEKKNIITNDLAAAGAKGIDLLLNVIDYEALIIKDGKALNSQDIITPLKEKYAFTFENKITGNTPPGNQNKNLNSGSYDERKKALIEKYNNEQDFRARMIIDRQIRGLKKDDE
ncbi:MAG: phage scaffolding protein [Promethearchaeota archaeon]